MGVWGIGGVFGFPLLGSVFDWNRAGSGKSEKRANVRGWVFCVRRSGGQKVALWLGVGAIRLSVSECPSEGGIQQGFVILGLSRYGQEGCGGFDESNFCGKSANFRDGGLRRRGVWERRRKCVVRGGLRRGPSLVGRRRAEFTPGS